MAVVQSAYLTRHLGGAVLVFAFIHGVRTSVVWRAVCVRVCVCVCVCERWATETTAIDVA